MTARQTDPLIAAFLNEGPTLLPDQAFDAVRADIHRTRQRVVVGPWREPDSSTLARVAIAAAVVLAVGLAWVRFGPPSSGVGTGPTPIPSASTSPSLPPLPVRGVVEPGRYRISEVGPAVLKAGQALLFTVSAEWFSLSGSGVLRERGGVAGPGFAAWVISGTYVDPCSPAHVLRSPAPGPGVDDLIAALSDQPGVSASPPRDVTIDGYRGKSVELTVVTDITTCGGTDAFWLWADPTGDRRYVQDTGEIDRIYVLDVDGARTTFFLRISPTTTAAEIVELEAIVASIDIVP